MEELYFVIVVHIPDKFEFPDGIQIFNDLFNREKDLILSDENNYLKERLYKIDEYKNIYLNLYNYALKISEHLEEIPKEGMSLLFISDEKQNIEHKEFYYDYNYPIKLFYSKCCCMMNPKKLIEDLTNHIVKRF